jgi:Holliday junction resolvase RusA-like endonuclease
VTVPLWEIEQAMGEYERLLRELPLDPEWLSVEENGRRINEHRKASVARDVLLRRYGPELVRMASSANEVSWLGSFEVTGVPVPQGSKRLGRNRATGAPILIDDNAQLRPWREQLLWVATRALRERELDARLPLVGPVVLRIRFRFPRPRSHFGTGRNAGQLKLSAPIQHDIKPDLDKLVRAVLDALKVACLYQDDGQVSGLSGTTKVYANVGEAPGALISIGVPTWVAGVRG